MTLVTILQEVQAKTSALKDNLMKYLRRYVSSLDTKDGILQGDEDSVYELQRRLDAFYKQHSRSHIGYVAKMVKRALRLAMDEMDGEESVIEEIERKIGIEGEKVRRYADSNKMTVLFTIGAMAAIRSDLMMLTSQAFNGEVMRKDYEKSLLDRASRRFHDFYEVYVLAAVSQSYNAAKIIYAKDKGYDKFLYVGGLVDESREFCIQRAGHEFTIEEAETWNDMWWKGKIEGVDFFIQIGGYNCGHYLEFLEQGKSKGEAT